MNRVIKISIILLSQSLFVCIAPAQTKIQVVTKTISKTFDFKPAYLLEVKSEKATVQVTSSRDNKIHVKILLISKNPSRKEAERDLNYCDYQFKESSASLLISNFFNSKNNYKEISSNLNAKYEIEIPDNIHLTIKNIYGNILLSGVVGDFQITSDFGQVELSDVSGICTISSNYSDIKAIVLKASTTVNANKADISISEISKPLSLKNQYGKIILGDIKASVTIDAEMTEIELNCNVFKNFSFDITSLNGEISVPPEFKKYVESKHGDKRFTSSSGIYNIKVKTTYNTISLKKWPL